MKKRMISILMACILSVGLLAVPAAAAGNEPPVDDVPYEPVSITLTQGIAGGASGAEIYAMPGDGVYYLVSICNRSDARVTGQMSLGVPVLPEAKSFWTAGLSRTHDNMLSSGDIVLEPGETAYAGVVVQLPDRLDTTGWFVQAQFVFDDGGHTVLSRNASCLFGEPELSLKADMTGGSLHIRVGNDKDATGGASCVTAVLTLKSDIPDKVLNASGLAGCADVQDGRLVISLGSLVPGGKIEESLGNLTQYVDVSSLEVTYLFRGETVTVK